MRRLYYDVVKDHLRKYRQMIFLCGPRQVGKTTLSKACADDKNAVLYLNWDSLQDRDIILSGVEALKTRLKQNADKLGKEKPIIIFDEIHKHNNWKNMLKGYFDHMEHDYRFIVTGSARLNVYRRGGDSMMGRYFPYRIHPFSVAECLQRKGYEKEIHAPQKINATLWQNLYQFGGFPEPFNRATPAFYNRWQKLKQEQLFREDLRDLTRINDFAQLELLSYLLKHQVGGTITYSSLAKKVQVSEPTIKSWLEVLNNVYYCFSIRPWSRNVTKSLVKKPKVYLWDWAMVEDKGARVENFIACHLYKAVHFWTDIGLGHYELYYLRDIYKREVDFLVVKNGEPWIMVEAKSSENAGLSSSLVHFCQQLKTPHTFQVAFDMPYVAEDCFKLKRPMIVPARTLLSQLV